MASRRGVRNATGRTRAGPEELGEEGGEGEGEDFDEGVNVGVGLGEGRRAATAVSQSRRQVRGVKTGAETGRDFLVRGAAATAAGEGVGSDAGAAGGVSLWAGKEEPLQARRGPAAVVLVRPQIPGNAGTVARTCAATATALHLVGPLGFEITDARLKRAGLDYWDAVCVQVHEDWDAFARYFRDEVTPATPDARWLAFSAGRSDRLYCRPDTYRSHDWLLFGSETEGLPEAVLDAAHERLTIPIDKTHVRSLNLAVSASVALFEAVRQVGERP